MKFWRAIFAIAFLSFSACLIVTSALQPAENRQRGGPLEDLKDTTVTVGTFTTLGTAVKAAGLVATVKSKGRCTVCAPTDEACATRSEASALVRI